MAHITQQQQEELRQKLMVSQQKLKSVLADLLKTDPVNDPDRVDDNADVGTDAIESNELIRHESLEKETTIMLDRIEGALKRMDDGTYGHTSEGQDIPYERLLIDPTITTVVS